MTCGWAIIIVIIVGVALWRLGVFTPSAGHVATGFSEFSASDFKITSSGAGTIVLVNHDTQSRTVTMNEVTMGGAACTGDSGSHGAGDNWTISCTSVPAGATGNTYTGVAVVANYSVAGVDHIETGKITGQYE